MEGHNSGRIKSGHHNLLILFFALAGDDAPAVIEVHTPFNDYTDMETVCLLSKKNAKPKDCVEISVDAEDYYRIKSSEKDI